MPSNPDEPFDVVNQRDEVIMQLPRHEVHRRRLFHRAVHILVFNGDGDIYMQRRSPHKDTYPNRWTTSCSGHVDAGETYDIAAVRELGEELGIRIDSADTLDDSFTHSPCRATGYEFIHVYRLVWNGEIVFDPEEISEGRWFDPQELAADMQAHHDDYAPSFHLVWELFQATK
ncbi:MAG: NUDIX domain-containing protein [Verrucomicrobiota bacterium JB024]|nr:NUDIX domain-containing protein [Verrucomicrobiota bacterium JB024]